MLGTLRQLLKSDPRTIHSQAAVSGLADQTIKNIITGTTRRPQGVTVQMAYRMLGYRLVPEKIEATASARPVAKTPPPATRPVVPLTSLLPKRRQNEPQAKVFGHLLAAREARRAKAH